MTRDGAGPDRDGAAVGGVDGRAVGEVAIGAARVAMGETVREHAWVVVADGTIAEVADAPPRGLPVVDLGDADLIPGLVDLHSDCLDTRARPRPTSVIPTSSALLDLDAEVAVHGITTHYVCAALHGDLSKGRSMEHAFDVVSTVSALRASLRVDHRIHLRVELLDPGIERLDELVAHDAVTLVSFMDHTPGQGQYRDDAQLKASYAALPADIDEILAARRARAGDLGRDRERVARAARARGAVLASHDDDSEPAVRRSHALGAAIAEFPVTLEAARTALALGMGTVMGAPNARRGTSHLDNLSAREALRAGVLGALASDYHPASLLAAAYTLADEDEASWPEAIALVTSGPARLAGLDDRGVIAAGRRADLVGVVRRQGHPSVQQVWRGGRALFGPTESAGTSTARPAVGREPAWTR